MKTAQEIYTEYRVMPSLQLHQLRVAAVAKLICEYFKKPVNAHDVVLAALFHDMGNILKFDLGKTFPEFLEPEGLEYWQKVKDEFKKRYGSDQHEASLKIAREIGLSAMVVRCVDAVAFAKAEATLQYGLWEEKICEYADTRVGPRGVLPVVERLEEGRKRYEGRSINSGVTEPRERFDQLVKAELEIERLIFANTRIKPEDINDAAVEPVIEQLRTYTVA
ncbi:HD domain-containing protein [Candidatus Kaiserbacteria bacterium]|nr:HD domain-containing protein [Candidatus Kaiserbacteria bacterium]